MNKDIEDKNNQMKQYSKQMETIFQNSDNLGAISWKDQKEGIIFTENPNYKPKNRDDSGNVVFIKQEIQELEAGVVNKTQEIQKLLNKEQRYLDQLEKLKLEYQINKKKMLDEGTQDIKDDKGFREFH